ncbi:hypothetical protein YC2023_047923 [Brassica napus]
MIRSMEFWNRNKRNDSVFRKLQKGLLTNLKQSRLPTHSLRNRFSIFFLGVTQRYELPGYHLKPSITLSHIIYIQCDFWICKTVEIHI